VNEAEHSGAPGQITIQARSAALGKNLRDRKEESWHCTTLAPALHDQGRVRDSGRVSVRSGRN